jgi:hypothetical protein
MKLELPTPAPSIRPAILDSKMPVATKNSKCADKSRFLWWDAVCSLHARAPAVDHFCSCLPNPSWAVLELEILALSHHLLVLRRQGNSIAPAPPPA